MPRQLPWVTHSSRAPKKPPAPLKRPAVPTRTSDDEDEPDRRKRRTDRALSSSPVAPPSPLLEEFMKEGLAADDIWIMVEDEFLDTAKLFTRHLHRAEYQRLKSLAKVENARKADNISRPAVNEDKASTDVIRRVKSRQRERMQQAAVSDIDGTIQGEVSSDEDAPWMFEPHLGKLMKRPPPKSKNLATAAGIRSKSRAAAGFAKPGFPSPSRRASKPNAVSSKHYSRMAGLAQELGIASASRDDEVDEDDLDMPATSGVSRIKSETVRTDRDHTTNTDARQRDPSHDRPNTARLSGRNSFSKLSHQRDSTETSTTRIPDSKSKPQPDSIPNARGSIASKYSIPKSTLAADEDDWSVESSSTAAIRDRMNRRRTDRAKKEIEEQQQAKKSYSLDEIPTFLY